MSYIAKHYVNIAGQMYTPGEIIDREIAESKLQRLIRLGAVTPCPGAIVTESATDNATAADGDDEKQEVHVRGNAPADEGMTTEDEAEETETEEYEEADAPEIDVMDGIVSTPTAEEAAEEAPPKKTTNRGRKKA